MTRIFITGDTHGDIDWNKLKTKRFSEQKILTKEDYLIIAGDFGCVWSLDNSDKYFQKTYNERNFTTLFIDGNHENHNALDSYPITKWNGGKIHKISDSIFHLMRGQVFTIAGKSFFTMGGAESTDKDTRTEGINWWARELPSIEEYEEAAYNLSKHDWKVDCVITHCAPEVTVTDLGMPDMRIRKPNELTQFFDSIASKIECKDWYFGHYHRDSDLGRYHLMYQRIIELNN